MLAKVHTAAVLHYLLTLTSVLTVMHIRGRRRTQRWASQAFQ